MYDFKRQDSINIVRGGSVLRQWAEETNFRRPQVYWNSPELALTDIDSNSCLVDVKPG